MRKSRRDFLLSTATGLGAAAMSAAAAPPGAGAASEKLMQVQMSPAQRAQAAGSWRSNFPGIYERRTGPRKVDLPASAVPYSTWNPLLPGQSAGPSLARFVRSATEPGRLPARDADIAFSPVTRLSRRRDVPTRRSPPAATAGRCTAYPLG